MKPSEVARHWERNADAWTRLARAGYDIYRDLVNTPAFLRMLPDVSGLRGLDLGCGEGHHARVLSRRGARMTGFDVARTFVRHARNAEREEPLGGRYLAACATELPFADSSFDFAIATMSLMDVHDPERAVAEVWRVLRPGGFFQFSILHPCFSPPVRFWVDDGEERIALACGDYFRRLSGEAEEWLFQETPEEIKRELPPFRTPRFTRTLSEWLNLLSGSGFVIEQVDEPHADEETARAHPEVADTRIVPFFWITRCRRC